MRRNGWRASEPVGSLSPLWGRGPASRAVPRAKSRLTARKLSPCTKGESPNAILRTLSILATVGVILAMALLPLLLIPTSAGFIGDGDYSLTIHLRSKSNTAVRQVKCYLYLDLSKRRERLPIRLLSYFS